MKIEKAKSSEYKKIMRFLEDVYGHPYNYFSNVYPAWKEKNTFLFENTFIIKEHNEIVSLVRIFPLNLLLNGVKIKVGGIGSVSTSFSCRGKGYMSILLKESIEEMKRKNYPVSILWGDRHRYINFGYENAGQIIEVTITKRGLDKCKIKSIEGKKYLGEKDVFKKIFDSYNKLSFRKERTKQEADLIYKRQGMSVYYAINNNDFVYIVIEGNYCTGTIIEQSGKPSLLLSLLRSLEERFGTTNFTIQYPNVSEIPDEILDAVSSWRILPSGMVKILNLKDTFDAYKKVIEKYFPEGEEISFQMEGGNPVILKKTNKELIIEEGKGKNFIFLKEHEMVKLVFGTFLWYPSNISFSAIKIIKNIFPLKIFLWRLDHI